MTGLRRFRLGAPCVALAFFVACGSDNPGDDGGEGGDDGSDDDGGGAGASGLPATASELIGKKGGKIETSAATLTFPPGALSGDTRIEVSTLSAGQIADLPPTAGGVALNTPPVRFEPHGLRFDEPVGVELAYDAPGAGSTSVVVMKLDDEEDDTWEFVGGTKAEDGKATFTITGFSIYGVFEDPEGTAAELYGRTSGGAGGSGGGSGGGTGGQTQGGGSGGTGGQTQGGGGTGGQGLGGAASGGSGGQGLGGAASGGSGGHGMGGAASGGVGGTGGSSQSGPGYYVLGEWHGHGELFTTAGAFVSSSVASSDSLPVSMSGSLAANAASAENASLVFRLNQLEGGPAELLELQGDGVIIEMANTGSADALVVLGDGADEWCAYVYSDYYGEGGAVTEFIAYDEFGACPSGGSDFAGEPVEYLAVRALGNAEYESSVSVSLVGLGSSEDDGYGYFVAENGLGSQFAGYGTFTADTAIWSQTNVARVPSGNERCARGLLAADAGGTERAEMLFATGQDLARTIDAPVVPTSAGISFAVNGYAGSGLRAVIIDDVGNEYCVNEPGYSYRTWSDFTTTCWDSEFPGTPYDGVAPIIRYGVVAPAGVSETGFDFCFDAQLSEGPGFYVSGPWHGEGSVIQSVGSSVSSSVATQIGFPVWIAGTVGMGENEQAGLRFNLNQESSGAEILPVAVTGDGIWLYYYSYYNTQLRVAIGDGETEWCSDLYGTISEFTPYERFETNCGAGGGTQYQGEPIEYVSIYAVGDSETSQSVDFYVDSYQPLSSLGVGYFEALGVDQSFTGYGRFDATGAAWAESSVERSSSGTYCARGELNADPTLASRAAILFSPGETFEGVDAGPIVPVELGILFGTTNSGAGPLHAVLIDDSGTEYCAVQDGDFVAWTDFRVDCAAAEPGAAYAGEPIAEYGVAAPAYSDMQYPFEFCIQHGTLSQGPGYVNQGYWRGNASFIIEDGAAMSSDVDTSVGLPMTMSGNLDQLASQSATMRFNLNQSTSGGAVLPVEITGDGVRISATNYTPPAWARIVVGDGTTEWCTFHYGRLSSELIPWSEFYTDCEPSTGTAFAGEPITYLAIRVEGTTAGPLTSAFTVYSFGPEAALADGYGYLVLTSSGDEQFEGYGTFETVGASRAQSNITRGNYVFGDAYCARGSLDPDPSGLGVAEMFFNANEDLARVSQGTIVPEADGITYWIDNSGGSTLRVVIVDDAGVEYCAPAPGYGSSVAFSSFRQDCGSGEPGPYYSGEPISKHGVVVPSHDTLEMPFEFCFAASLFDFSD